MSQRVVVSMDIVAEPGQGCAEFVAPKRVSGPVPRQPALWGSPTPRGRVILRAVITIDGGVRDVAAYAADDARLMGASEQALKLWRFTPAICDGRAVESAYGVTFYFGVQPRG